MASSQNRGPARPLDRSWERSQGRGRVFLCMSSTTSTPMGPSTSTQSTCSSSLPQVAPRCSRLPNGHAATLRSSRMGLYTCSARGTEKARRAEWRTRSLCRPWRGAPTRCVLGSRARSCARHGRTRRRVHGRRSHMKKGGRPRLVPASLSRVSVSLKPDRGAQLNDLVDVYA